MSGETPLKHNLEGDSSPERQDTPPPGEEPETAMEVSQEVNPSDSTKDSITDNPVQESSSDNIVVATGIRHRPDQFTLPRDAALSDEFLRRNRMAADLYGTQGSNLLVQAELNHQQKPIFDPVTLHLQQKNNPGEKQIKQAMQTR